MLKRPWHKLSLLLVVLLSMSPAAYAARPDTWITMKAKTALYLAPDIHGMDINVDTINGHVTLHGTVGNETERKRAKEEVGKIEGVVDVRNLLQVANKPANQDKTQHPDAAIKADVDRALKGDRWLEDSSIAVKSVDNGVVVLAGRAASPSDNLRALRIAASRPGVVRITSDVVVPESYDDEDFRTDMGMSRDSSGKATMTGTTGAGKETTRTAGVTVSDLWITSATKMKLAGDSRTPATEINVDTYDGVVTLFGMVPSKESKAAAAEIAHSVSGVKRVDNKIEVVRAPLQEKVQAKDDGIREDVEKTLKARGDQDNAAIGVEVSNGVVRLTGKVPTYERSLSAVYAARSVAGVRSVRNELKVENDHTS